MFFVVAADAGGCVDCSLQTEKVFMNFPHAGGTQEIRLMNCDFQ